MLQELPLAPCGLVAPGALTTRGGTIDEGLEQPHDLLLGDAEAAFTEGDEAHLVFGSGQDEIRLAPA
jgi:hypothetical protein